jgi:hypothetical protein
MPQRELRGTNDLYTLLVPDVPRKSHWWDARGIKRDRQRLAQREQHVTKLFPPANITPGRVKAGLGDLTGEICTRWNERESTWRKSGHAHPEV